MKYGYLLNNIISNQNIKNYYIDYNFLKNNIFSDNFVNILEQEIDKFNKNYKILEYSYDSYCYLLINYLTINKIFKKYTKNNKNNLSLFYKKYNSIHEFLSKFTFFSDIINIPENIKSDSDIICPICLDYCKFPVTTKCNHTYCWKCLFELNLNFNFCPYCKNNTSIDPVIIILNTLLPVDKKYSPFINLKKNNQIKVDIVSDLHIDQWSYIYENKYPCGKISEFPFKFTRSNSDYLIVAGDISDNLEYSINYLNNISSYYEKILFVDGNHEHVHKYPELFNKKYISKIINNNKIVYLPDEPFKINTTLFIGCCGWWDYENENVNTIKNCTRYFDDWIKHFSIDDNLKFINNVINKSKEEYNYLNNILEKSELDDDIKDIVIITHTIPDIKFAENHSVLDSSATQYNTKFKNLFKYSKLKTWIFGHTHKQWNDSINGVNFICNPRGRPDDFNREQYSIKSIEI